MAMKKKYYSVNGQILFETTPGASAPNNITTYGRDALGSVVAGYDGNGNAVFTGRYKPYGEFAATSGSVTGKRFMWAGSHGYRFTSGVPVSHYVRARHYSMRMGMWSTRDPIWPRERAFAYVSSQVATQVDPSGLQENWEWEYESRRGPWEVVSCSQGKGYVHRLLMKRKGKCKAYYSHYVVGMVTSGTQGEVQPIAQYADLWQQLRVKCGISESALIKMFCEEDCCAIAKSMGADPNSVCAIAITERTTRSQLKDSTQDLTARLGIPQGLTFGCLQISTVRAKEILNAAKLCDPALYAKLVPPYAGAGREAFAKKLLDCNYSLKLASADQILRRKKCKYLGRFSDNGLWDYSKTREFGVSWNPESRTHVARVTCAYDLLRSMRGCS